MAKSLSNNTIVSPPASEKPTTTTPAVDRLPPSPSPSMHKKPPPSPKVPAPPPNTLAETLQKEQAVRESLTSKVHTRGASLTGAEAFFLRALLLDDDEVAAPANNPASPEQVEARTEQMERAVKKLNDEMLFSVPKDIPDFSKKPPKPRRPSTKGLWSAFEDGVHPQKLRDRSSFHAVENSSEYSESNDVRTDPVTPVSSTLRKSQNRRRMSSKDLPPRPGRTSSGVTLESSENYASDEEVRPDLEDDEDSSWDSKDDANHRGYDAWEILKDEYSSDFGFDFTAPPQPGCDEDDGVPNSFQILGTSGDDETVQPHVMSPPMMDALMNFLPEALLGQNFWLRFSLIRDGASLDTLKRYARASQYTIIAIETPKGEVFGSFTSSHWRNNFGFYGRTPAFVWKMRHSRQTKCASLFDQAQLESEIDVFMAAGFHDRIQVCRNDAIAVGGDEDMPRLEDYDTLQEALEAADESGFAFCLDDDLLRGTTSHCSTFHNPSLVGSGNKTEIFEVAGLEVWTLTPCFDVSGAEQMEMRKFFVDESIRSATHSSLSSLPSTPGSAKRNGPQFSSRELEQGEFYRRIGHDDPDSESRRETFQYVNTMSGISELNKGLGASPRFT